MHRLGSINLRGRLHRPSAASVVSFLVVVGVMAFTFVALRPSLLFANTTVAGGDTGSQVGLPYYFEHGILGHLRLTGWSPWWYDGYPQYTFYFPLPGVLVAILNLVFRIPYTIAFKLITVAGSLLLPVAAWTFGRLSRMRRPGPECLAIATLPFLFWFNVPHTDQIVGGNLASTLAGEYSYSLSLTFGIFFLAVVMRGLDTGRRRGLAAVLLAATTLCHVVPAIFVGVVAAIITLVRLFATLDWRADESSQPANLRRTPGRLFAALDWHRRPWPPPRSGRFSALARLVASLDWHRLWWSVTAGAAGLAIIGFWAIPFVTGLPYTSSLGFARVTDYEYYLFLPSLIAPIVLGAIGAVISLFRRHYGGIVLLVMAAVAAGLFRFDPVSSLYNARFLPFWALCVFMLAGVGFAELATLLAEVCAKVWGWWRSHDGSAPSDLGKAVLAALGKVEAGVALSLAARPEVAQAVLDAHSSLARDRVDLAADPTEWGAWARERVRTALVLDPALALAYELKEAFVAATGIAMADPTLAMPAMDLWAALAMGAGHTSVSGLAPFARLGRQLRTNRPELAAYLRPGRPRLVSDATIPMMIVAEIAQPRVAGAGALDLTGGSPKAPRGASGRPKQPNPVIRLVAPPVAGILAIVGFYIVFTLWLHLLSLWVVIALVALMTALAIATPWLFRVLLPSRSGLGPSPSAGRDPRTFKAFTGARPIMTVVAPIVACIAAAGFVAVPLGVLPITVATASYLPGWINWNYTGYQGKTTYPEYHAINTTMARVGATYGCGRAMWEYGPELNDLGTPEALMLLPYWTHGCIDSMEGLLFESSATTPYHFLNQAELSQTPSDADAGLPYGSLDVAKGIQHLQLLGVKYYMAFTPAAQAQANADPALTLISTTGPWPTVVNGLTINRTWDIYLVANSTTVTPLDTEPVVLTGINKSKYQSWLNASLPWYDDPSKWNVMLAESGPSSWERVPAYDPNPPVTPVTPTAVSHIVNTDNTISFDVTRLGSPVLVKTSYFPNWQASGATGPFRVAPNLMVVVPSSHHVTLTYGRTGANWLGTALTIAGLAGAGWMAWRPPVPMRGPRRPAPRLEEGTEGEPEVDRTGVDTAVV